VVSLGSLRVGAGLGLSSLGMGLRLELVPVASLSLRMVIERSLLPPRRNLATYICCAGHRKA